MITRITTWRMGCGKILDSENVFLFTYLVQLCIHSQGWYDLFCIYFLTPTIRLKFTIPFKIYNDILLFEAWNIFWRNKVFQTSVKINFFLRDWLPVAKETLDILDTTKHWNICSIHIVAFMWFKGHSLRYIMQKFMHHSFSCSQ